MRTRGRRIDGARDERRSRQCGNACGTVKRRRNEGRSNGREAERGRTHRSIRAIKRSALARAIGKCRPPVGGSYRPSRRTMNERRTLRGAHLTGGARFGSRRSLPCADALPATHDTYGATSTRRRAKKFRPLYAARLAENALFAAKAGSRRPDKSLFRTGRAGRFVRSMQARRQLSATHRRRFASRCEACDAGNARRPGSRQRAALAVAPNRTPNRSAPSRLARRE